MGFAGQDGGGLRGEVLANGGDPLLEIGIVAADAGQGAQAGGANEEKEGVDRGDRHGQPQPPTTSEGVIGAVGNRRALGQVIGEVGDRQTRENHDGGGDREAVALALEMHQHQVQNARWQPEQHLHGSPVTLVPIARGLADHGDRPPAQGQQSQTRHKGHGFQQKNGVV